MRETFTSGSVGRAPGNRCLYPEPDCLQRPLVPRSRCQPRLMPRVRGLTKISAQGSNEVHWGAIGLSLQSYQR